MHKFLNRSHTELIQRSVEIVKFLCMEKCLSSLEMDTMWESTMNEGKKRAVAIFTLFQDVGYNFAPENLRHLMNLIISIPPENVTEDTIRFALFNFSEF